MKKNVSPTVVIQKASCKHLDTILKFNLALALETENRVLNKEVLRQSIQAVLEDHKKGTYLVACIDQEVVGQVMYTYEWSTWRNAYFMWITDLYIPPAHRKKGIFKHLSDYVMDLYHRDPHTVGLRFCVDKTNTAVAPIYQKAGWKEGNYNLWEIKKDGCL